MTARQQLTTSSVPGNGRAVWHVGCSGWQYPHWRGSFYPAKLPAARWLEHYAASFSTVEINNTFYRLQEAATFRSWAKRTPPGFVFAVKASRFLTHMKKLKDPEGPLELFFSRARALGRKLGPVLYQLPPRWPLKRDRLEQFLDALPPRRRHTLEFRDASWYDAASVYPLLERHRVALCLHDMNGSASGRLAVGPFVYVRFHGPSRYRDGYTDAALTPWADWLAARIHGGVPVFVYFNNDLGGHAPRDAIRLREMIERQTSASL